MAGSVARSIDGGRTVRLHPVAEVVDRAGTLAGTDVPLLAPGLADLEALARSPDPRPLRALVLVQRPELARFDDDAALGGWRRPLDGGYALVVGGELLAGPECCGDLGDLATWRDLTACRDGAWQEFWIGHPCLVGRHADGMLEIVPGVEPGAAPVLPPAGAPVLRIPVAALTAAVEEAGRATVAVAERLREALADLLPEADLREQVADALVGLPPPGG